MSRGSRSPRRVWVFLLLVAAAALLAQTGSVPHTHEGIGPGLYNQDHDLALLATLHGAATLSAAQPAMLPVAVVSTVVPTASDLLDSAPRPAADSRAPPHS
jgi:hypothetical protein